MAGKKAVETLCIHGDEHAFEEGSRAISFPIYQTASFSHLEPGHNGSGYDYTRESNPTRNHLEETLAAVEGAVGCVAFSSGMAAIRPQTKAIYLETPSNPMMNVTDIHACSVIAKEAGACGTYHSL